MPTQEQTLLAILALHVQITEALSSFFKRQDELLEQCHPAHRTMIRSFYNNGYFVPKGPEYEAFKREVRPIIDLDGDSITFYHQNGSVRQLIRLRCRDDAGLIKDAFEFIDAFEG